MLHTFTGGEDVFDIDGQGQLVPTVDSSASPTALNYDEINRTKTLNGDVSYQTQSLMNDTVLTEYGNAGTLETNEYVEVYDNSGVLMHTFAAGDKVFEIAGAEDVVYKNVLDSLVDVDNGDVNIAVKANGDAPYNGQNLVSNNAVLDDDGNNVVAVGNVDMLDSSGNLIHRFTSGQTVYEVEGAVEMIHSLGDTLTHAAGDVKYHVEGDLQYLKLGATRYHKVGDEVFQEDGDTLYHDIGDNETHKIGEQMFFEQGYRCKR